MFTTMNQGSHFFNPCLLSVTHSRYRFKSTPGFLSHFSDVSQSVKEWPKSFNPKWLHSHPPSHKLDRKIGNVAWIVVLFFLLIPNKKRFFFLSSCKFARKWNMWAVFFNDWYFFSFFILQNVKISFINLLLKGKVAIWNEKMYKWNLEDCTVFDCHDLGTCACWCVCVCVTQQTAVNAVVPLQ